MYEKSIENVKKGIDNDKVKWYPILISTDLYKGGTLVNLLKEAGVWRHIEQIQFVTDDEEEEVTNEGHFKETVG